MVQACSTHSAHTRACAKHTRTHIRVHTRMHTQHTQMQKYRLAALAVTQTGHTHMLSHAHTRHSHFPGKGIHNAPPSTQKYKCTLHMQAQHSSHTHTQNAHTHRRVCVYTQLNTHTHKLAIESHTDKYTQRDENGQTSPYRYANMLRPSTHKLTLRHKHSTKTPIHTNSLTHRHNP